MKYSVEEHSSNTKILGNVHNWAWSLLFLSGSFMIGYLTSMFFKIWKIWNKTRNETIVKTSSESNKKLDKIKNPNAFASNFKEKNEDHQKYMPK